MSMDYEKIYEGYARETIEIAKKQMEDMETDELREYLERSDPAGFLEEHGLKWKDALGRLAAESILNERITSEEHSFHSTR